MIQGHRTSKLSEGLQKTSEKSSIPKFPSKNKSLPEKTKFTLQYSMVHNQPMKTIDKKDLRSLTPQNSRIIQSARVNSTAPPKKDIRMRMVRDQKLTQRDPKPAQFSQERKISSLPFLKTHVDNKSIPPSPRRLTNTTVPVKIHPDSKIGLLPPRRSNIPQCQRNCRLNCKAEMKTAKGKIGNSKSLANSPMPVKLTDSEKSIENMIVNLNEAMTGWKPSEDYITEAEVKKARDEIQSSTLERGRRNWFEEDGNMTGKHRSRSQEVKRLASRDNVFAVGETVHRKRSEGKILFGEFDNTSFSCFTDWKNKDVSLDSRENTLPSVSRGPSKLSVLLHDADHELNDRKNNSIFDNSEQKIMNNHVSRPTEDYYVIEPQEKHRDEDLTLDKTVWSNIELQIKETCEKTDFFNDSGDDSGDNISDIIRNLLSNREDDDLFSCIQSVEPPKLTSHPDDWKAFKLEDKSTSEAWNPPQEKEKPKSESKSKNLSVRPKSRRAVVEESSLRRISQESRRAKSSEDSKISCVKSDLGTKNFNGNLKCQQEEPRVKSSMKKVNFQMENKHESLSPSFFTMHPNIGFIGKDVDEEHVSFEPAQIKLYQPHEGQMLLYDIANCAATQGYLKMCGMKYEIEMRKNAEQMSPSGRVPFISSSLCIIPEFEAIVSFMQYKKFACYELEENDKPTFRGIISMIVDILETAERYICWCDNVTLLNYTKPRTSSQYPFPLNHIMHWKKKREEKGRLTERGCLGRSLNAILGEINTCLQTLSIRLGNNDFFFGKTGTEVDALVYGHVYAIFTTEMEGPLRDLQIIIQKYPNLINFAFNFDKMFAVGKFSSIPKSYWDNISRDEVAVGNKE